MLMIGTMGVVIGVFCIGVIVGWVFSGLLRNHE